MSVDSASRTNELLMVIAKASLAPIMEKELADAKMAKLYDMTGKATFLEAKKKLGLGSNRIIDTWKRWERCGLIVKDGKSYRKVLE